MVNCFSGIFVVFIVLLVFIRDGLDLDIVVMEIDELVLKEVGLEVMIKLVLLLVWWIYVVDIESKNNIVIFKLKINFIYKLCS